ncbi:hypothetical protein AAF134_01305 [Synechococcus lacustris Tous-12m]
MGQEIEAEYDAVNSIEIPIASGINSEFAANSSSKNLSYESRFWGSLAYRSGLKSIILTSAFEYFFTYALIEIPPNGMSVLMLLFLSVKSGDLKLSKAM